MVLNEHFNCPTRILEPSGWAEALAPLIGGRRWILVTSGGWQRRLAGAIDALAVSPPAGIFAGVTPNPTIDNVIALAAQASSSKAEVMVALGGGSVLDAAKSVIALFILGGDPHAFRAHLEMGAPLPPGRAMDLIAIPTTGGTGSEVTCWGTVWGADGRKFSVNDKRLYPAWALLDSALTVTQPRDLTLASGLDALSHSLEAIWNNNGGPASDRQATQAIALIRRNLELAMRDPGNIEARRAMQTAALYAGLAISRTRTALAHSISYPFTAHFGVPHGIACSFTLGEVARFNAGAVSGRLDIAAQAFECNVAKLPETLNSWLESLGVGPILQEYVPSNAIGSLAGRFITPSRAGNNLRAATETDAFRIAELALSRIVGRSARS